MSKRVVLVTGGGNGIGAAISRAFIANGDTVVIVQRSESLIAGAHSVACDLSDLDAIPLLIEQLIEAHGRLDVLVNNAARMQQSSAEQMSLADWQKTMDLNLSAPFMLIKHCLPQLRQTQGSIINISSIESLAANPLHSAYCASKAGLNGLTRAIAVDGGPDRVRCNAIAPGWIDTQLNSSFIDTQPQPEQFKQGLGRIHPLGRTGTPDEVAALAVWLASPAAGFVTGQVWNVDGGRMTQLSLPC